MFKETSADSLSKSRRSKVCGVGVNDSQYRTQIKVNGIAFRCPYYSKWRQMLKRCYVDGLSSKSPYHECKVCDDWLFFTNFKYWMEGQDWKGLELDKDIKGNGRKIYSPDTCLFVPPRINYLTVNCNNNKKSLLGAVYIKERKKYRATCRKYEGGRVFIGHYETEELAHRAYISYKNKLIKEAAETQPEHIKRAMLKYELKIDTKLGAYSCPTQKEENNQNKTFV